MRVYFEKMFAGDKDENEGLLVKVIPALAFYDLYLGEYAAEPVKLIRSEADATFPPLTLKSYLDSFSVRPMCE
jgi:hypothetical protein